MSLMASSRGIATNVCELTTSSIEITIFIASFSLGASKIQTESNLKVI